MTVTVDAAGTAFVETIGDARLRDLALFSQDCRQTLEVMHAALRDLGRAGDLPRARDRVWRDVTIETAHLTTLIKSLVDLAFLREGCPSLKPQPIDVNTVVDVAIEASLSGLAIRGITVTRTQPCCPCSISADPRRVGQVVASLIACVARSTPRLGRLDLTVQQSVQQVSVCVADVSADDHVEASVCRGVRDVTRRRDVGISLALVKHIVELHGGTLDDSWPAAGGARAVVTLPR